MATTAPKLDPDHYEDPERPTLVPADADGTRLAPHVYPFDPTQGRKLGSDRYDDPTQGRTIGSDPYEDPTRGR